MRFAAGVRTLFSVKKPKPGLPDDERRRLVGVARAAREGTLEVFKELSRLLPKSHRHVRRARRADDRLRDLIVGMVYDGPPLKKEPS